MRRIRNSKFKIRNSSSQSAIRNPSAEFTLSEVEGLRTGPQSVDPLMRQITRKIRARLPNATAIIFFGSRVAGAADAFSDYDVLVLLPEGLEMDERKHVKEEMQAAFPDITLDLLFGSERWLRARLPYEPYYRFWLKDSLTTWGKTNIKRFPPLATGAMKSYLGILKAEIDLAAALENCRGGSRVGIEALELLVQIDRGFKRDYSERSVKQALNDLVGADLIARVRNPQRRLVEKDRRVLLRVARAKYRAVKALLDALPENSADRRWRRQWEARSRANRSSNQPRSV